MIRGVLFDLDDTLTDRSECMAAYARRLRSDFTARLGAVDREPLRRAVVAADRGGYHEGQRSPDLLRDLPWIDPPSVEELDLHWEAVAADVAIARSGAHQVLEKVRARGLALGVVTNGLHETQHAKLRGLGLERAFDAVVVSESVGCEKPAPEVFAAALAGLGLSDAASVCFVGDHPRNDADGARRAGMHAVWLRSSHPWPEGVPAPAHTIEYLPELLPLIEALE